MTQTKVEAGTLSDRHFHLNSISSAYGILNDLLCQDCQDHGYDDV